MLNPTMLAIISNIKNHNEITQELRLDSYNKYQFFSLKKYNKIKIGSIIIIH